MTNDMGTAGEYSSWYFDDNYSEVFEYHYSGLEYNEWISSKSGKNILELLGNNNVQLSEADLRNLYEKISEADWRSGSCGGCI